jgi:exodeoxyribonuclease III
MVKVATWNVNSVGVRLERLLAFLKRETPDILCLQELKCIDEKFPAEAVRAAGYHPAIYGQKAYNGVAILTRQEPVEIIKGFGDPAWDTEARALAVKVGGLTIMSLYVPNGQDIGAEKFHYKLSWLKKLRSVIESRYKPSDPLVIVGDFNVAPEDRDTWDPVACRGQILCSAPEREAIAELRAFGFVDTFRLHHGGAGHFSWWDYRMLGFESNRGLRIDFIFATKPLAKLCSAAWIDRDERKGERPSDHAPVLAEFAL